MLSTTTTPAVLGGEPRPLINDPSQSLLGQDERDNLMRVFDQCAARGGREADEVEEFEILFAQKFGVEHAIATASATCGLQIAMQAHGVGQGDEVLISPYTFAASAHAVIHTGAVPVFTDIERETLCISPDAIVKRITPRTKAVMVVQIGGKPAHMNEITRIAKDHGLVVIEDAAQAHGSTFEERYVGTLSDAGVFSFSPKLMTSFRGGIIATNDGEIAERCRRMRFHGLPGNRNRVRRQQQLDPRIQQHFCHFEAGFSLMMTSLQAALLVPQLANLDHRFKLRHENAMYLAAGLEEIPGFRPIRGAPEGKSNFYMLEVLYDSDEFGGLSRNDLVTALSWEGVPISPVAATEMLAYQNPSLERYFDQRCPVAEEVTPKLTVFGHPLQSLVLHSDRSKLDMILDRIDLVRRHAEEIASYFASQEQAQHAQA